MLAEGKHTDTAAFPVVKYWQVRHQHRRVVIGSASIAYRTAPQRHPPVIVGLRSSAILSPVGALQPLGTV